MFAGVAWIAGEFLAAVLRPLLEGQPAPWSLEYQTGLLTLASLPLIIGIAIGVGIALGLISLRKSGLARK